MNQLILAGWTRVRGQLRAQVGESTYKNWLKPLDLVDYEDGTVTLSLPTTFMRDWVASHFGKQLTALWEADVSPVRSVSIIVLPDSPLSEGSNRPTGQVMPAPESPAAPSQPTGLEVSGAILPQYSFENYVVGAPNEFAYAAARRVSEFPAQDYNPLFLYGKYGLGQDTPDARYRIADQRQKARQEDRLPVCRAVRHLVRKRAEKP